MFWSMFGIWSEFVGRSEICCDKLLGSKFRVWRDCAFIKLPFDSAVLRSSCNVEGFELCEAALQENRSTPGEDSRGLNVEPSTSDGCGMDVEPSTCDDCGKDVEPFASVCCGLDTEPSASDSGGIIAKSSASSSCETDVEPSSLDSGPAIEDKDKSLVDGSWDDIDTDWACLRIFNNSGLSVEWGLEAGNIAGLMKVEGDPLEVSHTGELFV